MTLADQIADAEATLARLKRQAASATCADLGHDWHSTGGRNAGCHEWCGCSIPVQVCQRCGDCDYGDNDEARQTIADCAERYGQPAERFAEHEGVT